MYNIGILGNCCTHGAGVAHGFKNRSDTQVIAGYEADPRRAEELSDAIGLPLANSYDEVVENPGVDIVAITTDPCDKADMVEKACRANKHIFLNKPFSHNLKDARRIVNASKESSIKLVFDIPMVKFVPAVSKLQKEVSDGKYGKLISYYHAFGMTFDMDFPIRDLWPERFDPSSKSGGGEMTNMGCYAIDFAVSLMGMPKAVHAKWHKFWDEYRCADVENFGQIILDYGDFYGLLSVGKQKLHASHNHNNSLSLVFEHANIFIDPYSETLTINSVRQDFAEYLEGYQCESSTDQLLRCIEKNEEPESNAEIGAQGVEVLMAAYQSIVYDKPICLPLEDERNPLFEEDENSAEARS